MGTVHYKFHQEIKTQSFSNGYFYNVANNTAMYDDSILYKLLENII